MTITCGRGPLDNCCGDVMVRAIVSCAAFLTAHPNTKVCSPPLGLSSPPAEFLGVPITGAWGRGPPASSSARPQGFPEALASSPAARAAHLGRWRREAPAGNARGAGRTLIWGPRGGARGGRRPAPTGLGVTQGSALLGGGAWPLGPLQTPLAAWGPRRVPLLLPGWLILRPPPALGLRRALVLHCERGAAPEAVLGEGEGRRPGHVRVAGGAPRGRWGGSADEPPGHPSSRVRPRTQPPGSCADAFPSDVISSSSPPWCPWSLGASCHLGSAPCSAAAWQSRAPGRGRDGRAAGGISARFGAFSLERDSQSYLGRGWVGPRTPREGTRPLVRCLPDNSDWTSDRHFTLSTFPVAVEADAILEVLQASNLGVILDSS
uniref:Uncharacterized protein LOC110202588 n=1 Tax=Phascolarctos cinereus TaxID=38626 RepID=A0A6P5JM99_PHACI|nr:uncharacterized protein LOC110202588 [Phascolarctos cinereus]